MHHQGINLSSLIGAVVDTLPTVVARLANRSAFILSLRGMVLGVILGLTLTDASDPWSDIDNLFAGCNMNKHYVWKATFFFWSMYFRQCQMKFVWVNVIT